MRSAAISRLVACCVMDLRILTSGTHHSHENASLRSLAQSCSTPTYKSGTTRSLSASGQPEEDGDRAPILRLWVGGTLQSPSEERVLGEEAGGRTAGLR